MKINIFCFILAFFILLNVQSEEILPKLFLLNKDIISEEIKEIKNAKIVLNSGKIYNVEDSQEVFIQDKSEAGSYPLLLLNNGSMVYTKDFVLFNNIITYNFFGTQTKTNCDLVKGILFKNLSNDNSKIWKNYFITAQRKSDLIFVLKDDKFIPIEGVVREIDADKVKIQWEGQDKSIALDKVIGILFATISNETEFNFEIICIDGSKFRFDSLSMGSDGVCDARLIGEIVFARIAKSNIHRIVFNNRKTIFLSNYEPIEESSKSYMIFYQKNWDKNQNLWKKPLLIGGKSYINGIGVHATCVLKYSIPKGAIQFVTDYGIDDCIVNNAGCIFKIVIDKKEYLNEKVNSSSSVKTLIIDLPLNSQEITLIIEPGLNLDIGDFGVWGSARFIKK